MQYGASNANRFAAIGINSYIKWKLRPKNKENWLKRNAPDCCIWEMSGSNLDWDSDCLKRSFLWVSSVSPGKCRERTSNWVAIAPVYVTPNSCISYCLIFVTWIASKQINIALHICKLSEIVKWKLWVLLRRVKCTPFLLSFHSFSLRTVHCRLDKMF
jgi:hypothetical protein